jgi:3-oxoacyl-[acyl-carrier protein] reductase
MRLAGRVALVAGATGRIGGPVADALAAEGACVARHGRCARAAFRADLSVAGAADALWRQVTESLGPPDILVNLVHPQFAPAPLESQSWDEAWLPQLVGGLKPAVALMRTALPKMAARGFGRVVHISGGLSTRAARGCAPYAAAKAALNMLARTAALEFGASGITVNIVAPGEVRPAAATATDHPAAYAEVNAGQRAAQAVPGTARPADVAHAVLAFVDPAARFLTGQVMFVNGGQVMS